MKEALKKVYEGEKGLIFAMAVLVVVALALLIFSLVNLRAGAALVKVGSGDIGLSQGWEWSSMMNAGGYHDGTWMEMFAYPILALIFGVLNNLLAVRVYEKKGAGVAKMLVWFSVGLVVATFILLVRLLGEG